MVCRHDDLIMKNGLYAEMWSEQRKSNSNLPTGDESIDQSNLV